MRWGRPYVLVRWAGHDASGDTWAPLDNLTNREEAVAAFERATCRSLPPRVMPPPAAAVAPPPIPPAGFTVDLAPPGDLWRSSAGPSSTGGGPRTGCPAPRRGVVARLCPRGAFQHVLAHTLQSSALRGTADTLLDAACPRAPGSSGPPRILGGSCPPHWPGLPTLTFTQMFCLPSAS